MAFLTVTYKNVVSPCSRDCSMRKLRHCTFLQSVRFSLSLLRNKQFFQVSRLKAFSRW